MDLALDPNTKALTLGTVTGLDALAQRVYLRLSRLQGEWFLSLGTGLPPECVGSKPADIEGLRARLRAELLSVAGVLEVDTLDLTLNAATRHLTITARVRGVQGSTGVTV